MDEQGCTDYLSSSRELSAFYIGVRTAGSKTDVAKILDEHSLLKGMFFKVFPELAKSAQDLSDDDPPKANDDTSGAEDGSEDTEDGFPEEDSSTT